MKLSDGTFLKDRIEEVYNEEGNATSVDRNPLIGTFLRRLRITPYQSIKVKYDTSNVKQQAFINDIMQHESTNLVDGRKIKAYQNGAGHIAAKAEGQIDQRDLIAVSHGSQSVFADKAPGHQTVGNVVQLLKNNAGKHGQAETP